MIRWPRPGRAPAKGGAVESERAPLLAVRDLRKSYGSVRAVDGVSFAVPAGTVFTLLGPNGAGKTTTLEILEGIRDADSGEIEMFGMRVRKVTREMKGRMGVLLQEGGFEPYLRVREVLALFASFFDRPRPVSEVLTEVSLEDKAGAMVRHLSSGQKQRLALGAALINDPDLVFLDEPTTGLDPQARRNIWAIVERLKHEGKTIVLTTHYMEEAEALSDDVCIMDLGRVIARGSPRELTSRLGQDSFIEFDAPELPAAAWAALPGGARRADGAVAVNAPDLVGTLDALLTWSREHGVPLQNMTVRQPNLEDVFLSLTGRRLRG
ncbi:ABC transporter ATP-binding protein [Candidatus Bipolaricaulota bacterium]|nr:ABC transporter ATP-binding protein [Candidatus Bipolaricaulota bacterium]